MEWAMIRNQEVEKPIEVNNITKEEYEDKLKGSLYCIHGCDARIRFTERKNGVKYLSTWNNEGKKHSLDCEYHVNYKGKVGRKKLQAYNGHANISDEQIINAIDRKFKELTNQYIDKNKGKNSQSTNEVEDLGEGTVGVYSDNGNGEEIIRRKNITSIKAEYINSTYLELNKCVIGKVKNSTINNEDGNVYGYFNLKNENYSVSAYFPEAFFKGGNFTEKNFKRIVDIINSELENEKEIIVVCYGLIKNKKKSNKDFNINIIDSKRIKINGESLDTILRNGKIKKINI